MINWPRFMDVSTFDTVLVLVAVSKYNDHILQYLEYAVLSYIERAKIVQRRLQVGILCC
jgi:hypothetical protein